MIDRQNRNDMKMLLKAALKLAVVAVALSLYANAFAADSVGDKTLWKITLPPPGGEKIVSSIEIDPMELQSERVKHPGISRGSVVPCLAQGALFTDYYRLTDIAEFKAQDENNSRLGYGRSSSFPLNVTLKSGKKFEIASQNIDGAAHVWRICAESGDKFAFAFRMLNVRLVSIPATLKVHTAEVIGFKELTPDEVAAMKAQEIREFNEAIAKGTSKDIFWFIVSNTNKDVADLIAKAEEARKKAEYEEGAPMRAKQARMQEELAAQAQERARKLNKRAAELIKESAQFRKMLKVGDETNCGPVIEIKGGLVKVYHPVSNYGNEHWIRLEQVYPASQDCVFWNGQYIGSQE